MCIGGGTFGALAWQKGAGAVRVRADTFYSISGDCARTVRVELV